MPLPDEQKRRISEGMRLAHERKRQDAKRKEAVKTSNEELLAKLIEERKRLDVVIEYLQNMKP